MLYELTDTWHMLNPTADQMFERLNLMSTWELQK